MVIVTKYTIANYEIRPPKIVTTVAKLRLYICNRYDLGHNLIVWPQRIKSNRIDWFSFSVIRTPLVHAGRDLYAYHPTRS